MKAPPQKPGDVFLLFRALPYNFKKELPLAIGPNVYLDNTPQDILIKANCPLEDDPVDPAFYLPAYGALMNRCLRIPTVKLQSRLRPSDLFFLSVTALRLCAPLTINISIQFKLGDNSALIKEPALFLLGSPWQPDNNACYSDEDIRLCEEITKQLISVLQQKNKRIMSAATLFSQVTCGFSKSFQMSHLALFAALEALFVSKEECDKAKLLACRASTFLSNFDFPENLNVWLENEYKNRRNNLAHGVHDLDPFAKTLRPESEKAFGRLHEVTRLCVLGFMSLEDNKLASLSQSKGKQLQRELVNISPAKGQFLEDQRMWCS